VGEIDDLVAISRYAGRDVLLVQGGGGNTSVKSADGGTMWIKASGLRLAQVAHGRGYLATSVPALRALLNDPALASLPRQAAHEAAITRTQAATLDAGGLRPSLETTFHAVLGRLVLHTHPVYVNAFTCLRGGQAALSEALADPFVWVPYATPGYALGRAVAAARPGPCARLVLENHGLISSGETPAAVIADTERCLSAGQSFFGAVPDDACEPQAPSPALAAWAAAFQGALLRRYGLAPGTVAVAAATRQALSTAAHDPERWLLGGPLVPDDVVYGGHRVYAVDPARSAEGWLDDEPNAWPQTGRLIVALRGLGVILAGPSTAFLDAMEENLLAHVLVRRLIARRGEPQPLPDDEVQYLLNMESEAYRQRVAAQGD
jgi:rhamnose utilization protein RhaD (predicted bifunctional aldolase and dehydrogenase)